MGCSCKDCQQQIKEDYASLMRFRDFFINRMTIDSKTQDRRKSDYNQAIFGYDERGGTYAIWSEMDMVLRCFDDAMRDFRREYCDTESCRKGW